MIIAMPNHAGLLDPLTTEGLSILSKKYPNEETRFFFTTKLLLIDQTGQVIREDKKLPTRLTFIGHSEQFSYGPYSALDFSKRLAEGIHEASKLNAQIRTSIKTIDLLGCENGLMKHDGKSLTQTVADFLFAEGFSIRVNAFTNLAARNPYALTNSLLFHPSEMQTRNTFCYALFKSEANAYQYATLINEKRRISSIQQYQPVKDLYDSLNQIKNKWETENTNLDQCSHDLTKLGEAATKNTYFQSLYEKAPTLELKMVTVLMALYQNNIVAALKKRADIPKNPIECVNTILHHLNLHFTESNSQIANCSLQQESLPEVIFSTDDPRHYFDTTPACTFIPTQAKVTNRLGITPDQKRVAPPRTRSSYAAITAASPNRTVLKNTAASQIQDLTELNRATPFIPAQKKRANAEKIMIHTPSSSQRLFQPILPPPSSHNRRKKNYSSHKPTRQHTQLSNTADRRTP